MIQAGTNNIGAQPGGAAKVAEITRGLTAILDICRQKAPRATVILTAIFPRNDNMAVMPEIDQVNANLARSGRRPQASATSASTTSSPTRTGGCSQA